MGILDRILGRKGKVTGAKKKKIILTKKGAKGGYEKVMELAEQMTAEELYPSLTAGIYCIHTYEEGKSGFDSSEAFEVIGDEPREGVVRPQRQSMFGGLKEMAQDWREMKDDFKEVGVFINEAFGEKKVTTEDALSYLDALKKHRDTLNGIFPTATTASQEIEIEGKIPAALVYIPHMIEQSLNSIEQRLSKWDIIPTGGGQPTASQTETGIIEMPKKPTLPPPTRTRTSKELLMKLPDVPKVVAEEKPKVAVVEKKEEVRTEEVKSEEKEEEEDGGEDSE